MSSRAALCGCLGCIVCGECRACGESGCPDCGKPRGAYLALKEYLTAVLSSVPTISRNGRWVKAFRCCQPTIEAFFWYIRRGEEYDWAEFDKQTLALCRKVYRANRGLIESP